MGVHRNLFRSSIGSFPFSRGVIQHYIVPFPRLAGGPLITGTLTLKTIGTLQKCLDIAGVSGSDGPNMAGATVVHKNRSMLDYDMNDMIIHLTYIPCRPFSPLSSEVLPLRVTVLEGEFCPPPKLSRAEGIQLGKQLKEQFTFKVYY